MSFGHPHTASVLDLVMNMKVDNDRFNSDIFCQNVRALVTTLSTISNGKLYTLFNTTKDQIREQSLGKTQRLQKSPANGQPLRLHLSVAQGVHTLGHMWSCTHKPTCKDGYTQVDQWVSLMFCFASNVHTV